MHIIKECMLPACCEGTCDKFRTAYKCECLLLRGHSSVTKTADTSDCHLDAPINIPYLNQAFVRRALPCHYLLRRFFPLLLSLSNTVYKTNHGRVRTPPTSSQHTLPHRGVPASEYKSRVPSLERPRCAAPVVIVATAGKRRAETR